MKTLLAFLIAATAYLKVLPLLQLRKLHKESYAYEDEIFDLANDGSPASKLRMEIIAKRKKRTDKLISYLLAAIGDIESTDV